MSPNFLAKSVKFRWFRSSPTWSQFPNTGMGKGPGGSLNFLPRSFAMTMARTTAMKRATRVFSKRRRSMVVKG